MWPPTIVGFRVKSAKLMARSTPSVSMMTSSSSSSTYLLRPSSTVSCMPRAKPPEPRRGLGEALLVAHLLRALIGDQQPVNDLEEFGRLGEGGEVLHAVVGTV